MSAFNPAAAAIFTGVGCDGTYADTFAPLLPPDEFHIPLTGQPGDYFGPWYATTSLGSSADGFPFFICAYWDAAYNNPSGPEDDLYVEGVKPAAIYPSPDLASTDGYAVWTTHDLSAIGIGFILRWRVHNQGSVGGGWRSPVPGWSVDVPPPSARLPFWRFASYSWTYILGNYWLNHPGEDHFSSLAQYRAALDAVPLNRRGTNVIDYGAQVEVRYVLTQPASSIYSVLDSKSGTITTEFVTLRARPLSYQINTVTVRQTTTFKLPPTGTCKTPAADEATIHLNTLFATDLAQQGSASAYKPFTLTLTRCPRVPIRWYVHANGKWVNSAQGIVGLSGSTPDADPATGNPRGIGVQLAHDGGIHGTGTVYIGANPGDPNQQAYQRTAADGTDSPQGVTHVLPLRARVIRTSPAGTPIVPGPFNTSVIIAIQYP